MTLWPRRHSCIGVGLSGRLISTAQLSWPVLGHGRVGQRVEAAASVARAGAGPWTGRDVESLAGLLERAGFEGTRVVVAPGRGGVVVQPLELPPRSSGAPLAQIARAEMARVLRADPASIEVAMWDVPPPVRAGNASHVMAACLSQRASEELAMMFEGVGLEVVAIDTRSLSLARAARAWLEPTGVCMIVDVSWEGVSVIVTVGSRVVFERDVDQVSPAKMCESAAARWRLDEATIAMALLRPELESSAQIANLAGSAVREFIEEIVPEIARSAAYAAHRYPSAKLAKVFLCGEWGGIGGLKERVEQKLHAPARVLGGGDAMDVGPCVSGANMGPGSLLALGLALHPAHATHTQGEAA